MQFAAKPFGIDTAEAWTVYPALNRLSGPRGELQLEPRVMRLLLCLVAAGGAPLSRDELLEAVWGGDTFVSEGSLTLAISELRKILGDEPRAPRYIETIRKVGYRWLPAVGPQEEPAPAVTAPVTEPVIEPPVAAISASRRSRAAWWRRGLLPVAGLVVALTAGWLLATTWGSAVPATSPAVVLVPVTTYPGMEVNPDLSPDGQQLAFAHWQLPERRSRIRLKHLATETAIDLPGDPDFEGSPAWSPDGASLAFERCEGAECAIFVQPWPGGDPSRVTALETPSPTAIDWLPDGRSLVFADRREPAGPFRLFRVRLLDGVVEALAPHRDPIVEDLYPRVSPDGERIAFVRGDLEGGSERGLFGIIGQVMVMAVDGSQVEPLTPAGEEIFGLSWLPAGEGVVYAARTEGGNWELRRQDLGDRARAPRVVLHAEEALRNPVVGRDGSVVLERWRGTRNLWRVDLTSGQSNRLFESTHQDSEPVIAPEGSKIAFVSSRSGSQEVWLADRETGALHRLTELGGPPLLTPRWAPDGRTLAFVVREEKSSVLYRMAVEPPAAPQRVLAWVGSAMVSSWSRDGRWIYLGSNRSGLWQVWRVEAQSGAVELATPSDGVTAFELSDTPGGGTLLLFTRPNRDGIWQTELLDGKVSPARLLLPELQSFDRANWGVTSRGVYYAVRSPGSQAITVHLWDPVSGGDTPLSELPWLSPNAKAVSLSNDGTELFYSRLEGLNADLVSFPMPP